MKNSRYKKVELDCAIAGMVLHEAVADDHGSILLPSQTVLTDAMISSLERRGIGAVWIANDDISAEELQAEREQMRKRLAILFRKTDTVGATAALKKVILEYRLGEEK